MTAMVYTPLQANDCENDRSTSEAEDDKLDAEDPLLQELHEPVKPDDGEGDILQLNSRPTFWTMIIISLVALVSAFALYILASHVELATRRRADGLKKPDQYASLDIAGSLKGPKVLFPKAIIRANKAEPDKIYTLNKHVLLDDNNTMFFQWDTPKSKFTKCYIDSFVPPPADRLKANKTFISSGSLTSFQVWNVSLPSPTKPTPARLESVSWNTRPKRIALMGTVAWKTKSEKKDELGKEDAWQLREPTPVFDCEREMSYTVEVSCEGCYLEYDQTLILPPLAFDLFQIG